jgi:hypothetical protein
VADLTKLPWRTGRTLGRTMYARTGGDDYKADAEFGMLDTRELAAEACDAHNLALDLHWLLSAGLTFGIRTGDHEGAPGVLVCLNLDDPPLFSGRTLGEALAKAREWAEGEGRAC